MSRLQYNEKAYSALAAYLRGGRLPHAILLEGPRGAGKTTFAAEIAQGALCSAEPEQRPCGECRDCVKVAKGIHPDLIFYDSGGGSKSFHVDAVRELRQEAHVRPNEASGKVLVLEDVHNMTIQAGNALLKIIEEPPSGVVFVLTCENKAQLLETILSRVSVIELTVPTVGQCTSCLEEQKPGLTGEEYRRAAAQAAGNVGQALELLDAEGRGGEDVVAQEVFDLLCSGNELEALARMTAYEKDRDKLLCLLDSLATTVRTRLTGHVSGAATQTVAPLRLVRILAIIEELVGAVYQNGNRLLLTTILCAKIKLVLSR